MFCWDLAAEALDVLWKSMRDESWGMQELQSIVSVSAAEAVSERSNSFQAHLSVKPAKQLLKLFRC